MNEDFFSARRRALLSKLEGGGLVVMTGYGEVQGVNDNAAPFTQEANFWYLTGLDQPDWWLILDGIDGTEWLVAPELSDSQKVFDGDFDADEITKTSGIKTIISRDEATRRLRELAKRHSIVYTTEQPAHLSEHAHFQLNIAQQDLKKLLERTFQNVQRCNKELATLRTIKESEEIKAIERAIKLTNTALDKMMDSFDGAKFEYELEAELSYVMNKHGSEHAYSPIVASGHNACTLHYVANRAKLNKKNLLLVDVGARVDGYAADISRTYALGRASKRQEAVYNAVLAAQQEIIELLKPGLSFEAYEAQVELIMKRALLDLNLSADKYRTYFPHAIGHGLGRDVHDPLIGFSMLMPGMVMTVEPGVYIPEEGIGVRIEDDILITGNGHKNLSKGVSTALR